MEKKPNEDHPKNPVATTSTKRTRPRLLQSIPGALPCSLDQSTPESSSPPPPYDDLPQTASSLLEQNEAITFGPNYRCYRQLGLIDVSSIPPGTPPSAYDDLSPQRSPLASCASPRIQTTFAQLNNLTLLSSVAEASRNQPSTKFSPIRTCCYKMTTLTNRKYLITWKNSTYRYADYEFFAVII